MRDDVADFRYQLRSGIESSQDFTGGLDTLLLLVAGAGSGVLGARLVGSDVVEIGGTEYHGWITALALDDFFRISRDLGGASNAFEVSLKGLFHFYGDTVFEEVLTFGQQLWGQFAKALFSKLAVRCATEIHLRVDEFLATVLALPRALILEEFHCMATLGTLRFKDGSRLPETTVLTGALHGVLLVLERNQPFQWLSTHLAALLDAALSTTTYPSILLRPWPD